MTFQVQSRNLWRRTTPLEEDLFRRVQAMLEIETLTKTKEKARLWKRSFHRRPKPPQHRHTKHHHHCCIKHLHRCHSLSQSLHCRCCPSHCHYSLRSKIHHGTSLFKLILLHQHTRRLHNKFLQANGVHCV